MPEVVAIIFSVLVAFTMVFQLALVAGAPLGEFTLGGKWHGRLPPIGRGIALFSTVLLLGFSVVLLARSGLAFPNLYDASRLIVWVIVGYCALGIIANAATPSARERRIWLPVVIVMFICSTYVALS